MSEALPGTAGWVGIAVFALLGLAVLVSALAVVTRRNPVATVACLVVHFVATACLYVLLDSQFIAAVQILVYAGAIMVLFLFVIMLLSVDKSSLPGAGSGPGRLALVGSAALVLLTVLSRIALEPSELGSAGPPGPHEEDTVEFLATELFTRHLVAFELSSVPLLAAMAGVLVFTTRRSTGVRPPEAG